MKKFSLIGFFVSLPVIVLFAVISFFASILGDKTVCPNCGSDDVHIIKLGENHSIFVCNKCDCQL